MNKRNKINITLDGKSITTYEGEFILDTAKRFNIEIPTLCHDPRLKPFSSCFLCVVQIEGMKTLQPACSTRVSEGMNIETNNEKVRKSRKSALDLMLSNHYADCVAPCKQTCPAGVDVQGYISLIEKGLYSEAVALIKQVNPLPAICGRVCVRPCEAACRRNLLDENQAVGIDYIKRFASDIDLLAKKDHYKPKLKESTGKKVAIIGAGPGGLSAAYFLQQLGHQCDIYEAAPNTGGWLRYGIPEYRLPNNLLDKEIETITELGTKIYCNKKLGDNLSYEEINRKYNSTILTIGSQKGTLVGVSGDDAQNVYSGIDFLRNLEITGNKPDFSGKKIVVVGGGNTAMDCCRTSIRLGSTDVKVIYRRTEKEMPANPIEIHESKIEGVKYMFLNNPVKINKDKNGVLKSVTLVKMELGEPDASGRRRPIPIKDSEFEMEVDYILAAIGQKTDVNFIDDINKFTSQGELKINRWGDIDADPKTLQTGIKSVFAAGDGVTGAATIIEAIAQAKIAANSCHNFLSGKPVEVKPKEFLSKKDNFKKQLSQDYVGRYARQERHEMPVLNEKIRINFNEVELGYENEEVAVKEAQRCLECGCVEYYDCDLKKYSTQYQVDQKRFEGDFNQYTIDFSHPYVEIDNNKCILCNRCVRICKEVVGANALGLVNRGFETFVAPSMAKSLNDTSCESCGMCIEVCPTGAIAENFQFKPGPLKLDQIKTIDNYSSEGFEISLFHKAGFFHKVSGRKGTINKLSTVSRMAKFGYKYLNDNNRINKPLLKVDGKFEEISFKKAYHLIEEKIKGVKPDDNVFFASPRLTNEELYHIQKLARAGVKTNNIASFNYLGRSACKGYAQNANFNVPFDQLGGASKFYIFSSNLNKENGLINYMLNTVRYNEGVQKYLFTEQQKTTMDKQVDKIWKIKSNYNFIKAINYYLLREKKENLNFIKHHCDNFEGYKKYLLEQNFEDLVKQSGIGSEKEIAKIANEYNKELNAIIIFSEKEISSNTSLELFNLAMITGKLGKSSNGLLSIKEKNNSQGIFDMGILPKYGLGMQSIYNQEFRGLLETKWGIDKINPDVSFHERMLNNDFKNIFIFGEDPAGTVVKEYEKTIKNTLLAADFIVLQDYKITPTAEYADIILPSSFHIEIGGSFTNTQKYIQLFEPQIKSKQKHSSLQQLSELLKKFEINTDTQNQILSLLPLKNQKQYKHKFEITKNDNKKYMFKFGCDSIVKTLEMEFENIF